MLLEIKNLSVGFKNDSNGALFMAANNVNIKVDYSCRLGLIGESGCGKTITALTIMGLLSGSAVITGGEILFEGQDLLTMPAKKKRALLGRDIAMIFQEPMTALNPLKKVGRQIGEALKIHTGASEKEARPIVLETMRSVGLRDTEKLYNCYPFELSGGMRQRAMIAGSIILKPKILIADEPTTALDVTTQAQILHLLKKLSDDNNMALLFISHDFGVIYEMCGEITVMRGGSIIECGAAEKLLKTPEHEYTKNLLRNYDAKESE